MRSVLKSDVQCRVCETHMPAGSMCYRTREMMFGTRNEFDYFLCECCGCLQIVSIPENLRAYYPDVYYSFSAKDKLKESPIKRYLKRIRLNIYLNGSYLKKVFFLFFRKNDLSRHLDYWTPFMPCRPDSRILDVGCGSGEFLANLYYLGFSHLDGVDPFAASNLTEHSSGSRSFSIKRSEFTDVDKKYDIIFFNHSLEHMLNPVEIIQHASRCITDHGCIVIRLPVFPSMAWEEYETDWVQFDAPRHLCIHSIKSLNYLADNAGLHIVHQQYDSTEFQFLASEQIRRNIALLEPKSYKKCGIVNSIFTEKQILHFRSLADSANQKCKGDQVTIIMKKV